MFKLRPLIRTLLQSLLVLILAMADFLTGAILATIILGEQAAGGVSGYEYLQGNLPMLLLALGGVYVVSSFGEEALYRGYLMTQTTFMGLALAIS